jgi:hypothetical protein
VSCIVDRARLRDALEAICRRDRATAASLLSTRRVVNVDRGDPLAAMMAALKQGAQQQ